MDLRIQKTQKAIRQHFLELFYNENFDKITIKDITERAEIGRKTFYLHYIDKYDLLDKIVDQKMSELHDICVAKKELGLREGTTIWFDYFNHHRQFFTTLFQTSIAQKYKHQLQQLIADELADKLDEQHYRLNNIEPQLFLKFASSGIIELIDLYLQNEQYAKHDIEEQTYQLLKAFLNVPQ